MPRYKFEFREPSGFSWGHEAYDLADDGAAFHQATSLLTRHVSADHIEVWDGERAVMSRYREQPILRPVRATARPD